MHSWFPRKTFFHATTPARISGLLLLLVATSSCQGPAGPDGLDAVKGDIVAPELHIVRPAANGWIFADSTTFVAEQVDEDADLVGVYFQLNGDPAPAGDTLWAELTGLSRTVDLSQLTEYGWSTLCAVAVDTAGNNKPSAEILFRYTAPNSLLELAPGDLIGSADRLAVPDTVALTVDTIDTGWVIDAFSLAFVAPTDLILDSIEFVLHDATGGYQQNAELIIAVAPATSNGPGASSDTIRFVADPFSFSSPPVLDLGTLRGDSAALRFAGGDTFFVVFAPDVPDTLSGPARFNTIGNEIGVLTRDGELVQPGYGDLWLRQTSVSPKSWLRLSDLLESPAYYPRVKLFTTTTGSNSSNPHNAGTGR